MRSHFTILPLRHEDSKVFYKIIISLCLRAFVAKGLSLFHPNFRYIAYYSIYIPGVYFGLILILVEVVLALMRKRDFFWRNIL